MDYFNGESPKKDNPFKKYLGGRRGVKLDNDAAIEYSN